MFHGNDKRRKALAFAALAAAFSSSETLAQTVIVYGNNGGGRVVVTPGRPANPPARPVQPAPVPVRPGNGNARPPVQPAPARPGNGYGREGRVIVRQPRSQEQHELAAAEIFARHASDLSCGQLGELLRRISNEVLSASRLPEGLTPEERRAHPGNRDEWLARNRSRHLRNLLKRPVFYRSLMSRLVETFHDCDRPCFDDGVAIGIISGTGYCNAAIGVDGLPDPGFRLQDRLPLCETANFVGCQQGYSQAVNETPGCLAYATGAYSANFRHQISQDCNIEPYPY